MEITEYHKELLTRLAFGKPVSTHGLFLPDGVQNVLSKILRLQQDLQSDNVHPAVKGMYQTLIFPSCNTAISDNELIQIIQNDNAKYKASVIQSKLQQAILAQHNNVTFDWSILLTEIGELAANRDGASRSISFLDDVSFEAADVVGTFGYELLDHLISGGLTKGSYTVFYGATGVGKSTLVVAPLTLGAILKGKKPLIISLEGNEQGTKIKILQQFCGLCGVDQRFLSEDEKKLIVDTAKTFPKVPVVPCNASKRYELDKLVREFKPDVIIYDQLTLGANSRDWQDMAKISQTLQRLALETGIPVIALTQSDKKKSTDREAKKEGDAEDYEDIKYSQAIRQDATTVIKISIPFGADETTRVLTIEKTKDDSLSAKMGSKGVKIKVKWTKKGVEELGVYEEHRLIPTMDYLMNNRRVYTVPEKLAPIYEHVEEVPVLDVPVLKQTQIKTEKGIINIPWSDIDGDYDNLRYKATGKRLIQVAKELEIKELHKIGEVFEKNLSPVGHDDLFIGATYMDYKTHKPFVSQYFFKGGVADES